MKEYAKLGFPVTKVEKFITAMQMKDISFVMYDYKEENFTNEKDYSLLFRYSPTGSYLCNRFCKLSLTKSIGLALF